MRVLIVGCGYVGLPVGAELVRQGHVVYGVRRTGEALLKNAGIIPLLADITQPDSSSKFPQHFDAIINTLSSSRGGAEDYRQVYVEGTRHLLAKFGKSPPQKYIYTSSTSVYAQDDGAVVTEESPIEPKSPTSQVLVLTEQLLLEGVAASGFPAVILRVSGIYGPERGHLFLKYLRNEATLTGAGDRLLNMIHLDDLVHIIILALNHARPGHIYNTTDDEPITELGFYQWLSAQLHKPLPLSAAPDPAPRKRGLTSKRVSNAKLKAHLNYAFKYPTFRQGYTAEIERLKTQGLIPA